MNQPGAWALQKIPTNLASQDVVGIGDPSVIVRSTGSWGQLSVKPLGKVFLAA